MKAKEFPERAFLLRRTNVLRRRWVIWVPYLLGIILIVVGWSAAAMAAVIGEWDVSSGVLTPLVGSAAMIVVCGLFLWATIAFHGVFYEATLPPDGPRHNGPSWLPRAYGVAAWVLLLCVLWLSGRGFLEAASNGAVLQDTIHAVWVYSARALIGGHFGLWILTGLYGMMGRLFLGRKMAR